MITPCISRYHWMMHRRSLWLSMHIKDCSNTTDSLLVFQLPHPYSRELWKQFFRAFQMCLYLNDILVTGENDQDQLTNLSTVLQNWLQQV